MEVTNMFTENVIFFPRKQILRDLKGYLAREMTLNIRNNAWPKQIANYRGVPTRQSDMQLHADNLSGQPYDF